MPTFAVIGFDRRPKDAQLRETHRADHRAYVSGNLESLLCAGAMLDDDRSQCGSLYLFQADSVDQVREWLAKEPFVANGIYETLAVREIETSKLWTVPAEPPAFDL
ncbi:YciI family protein [Rhizorhabdus dicambivorans]|uniref:YCII-related domain-containing protein n=1 Tax=Rhizorhabdus dicambivorans TaxID=1850238 RepID=A0A2A4FUD4_9SPHN|nr:YciI family protein [Rhizorhabdus dicambivorans]ATE66236.1 hypothetical protein CMV14_19045 [Rhizorhabdus dicambivorans]PCE41749.1 hypothetical protein COO09_13385 [Rhizorhabdus dicambivorans]